MKLKFKTKNSNQPICFKNKNEHVGAGFMPAHNRGITLVALIITIILLLILAVVAITSISNSNIIKHAQNAGKTYTEEKEKEKISLAMQEALLEENGTVTQEGITKVMNTYFTNSGWKIISSDDKIMTIQITSSGRQYKITLGSGKIETVTGEKNTESWVNNGNGTFTKDGTTVEIGKTTYTNEEVQKKLGGTGGTYKGTWTVIGVEEDKLKLVSTDYVKSAILGCMDPGAIAAITVANEDSITEKEKAERSIWSYKNAITTLNTKAKEGTGIASARSIALEDIYGIIGEDGVTKKPLDGTYGAEYTFNYSNAKDKILIDENGETVKIDTAEKEVTLKNTYFQYTFTNEQKEVIGSSLSDSYYWLASCVVLCGITSNPGDAVYHVLQMDHGEIMGYPRTWGIYNTFGSQYEETAGVVVRAVVYM